MSKAEETKLHIKVVINKQKTKVLFAEAGSDFTDVLLSFLLLPLGTILKVLGKQYGDTAPIIGSLSALYRGVVNLDNIHFQAEANKQNLLFPASCYEIAARKLRLNVNFPQTSSPSSQKSYEGVYTESTASFIISDALQVMPNVAGSFMNTLRHLGISVSDMDGSETRNVSFGFNEILGLLWGIMVSPNPLTAFICGSPMSLASGKYDQGNALIHQIDPKVTSKNTKKMSLKVMIQKTSNKLLFAQADYDFINFLFGMLTVPLGRIELYFFNNSGLKSVDNLHKSLADESKKVPLKNAEILIKPPLSTNSYGFTTSNEFYHLNFDPDIKNQHVKHVRMYMVSDDLTVTPLAMTSCLSILEELKIPVSDVEELELQVGLEEGLSIMRAALTSTMALTDGLSKHMPKASLSSNSTLTAMQMTLRKRPKLEC